MGGATTFSRLTRRLAVLSTCAVVGATAAFVAPAAAAPSVNLDQCRNGAATAPHDCDATRWQNGNLNANQAHYVEEQSAPYRLVMTQLPVNTPVTVTLGYDTKEGGRHSIDFLTHYQRLEPHAQFGHAAEDILPTAGVSGFSATVDEFPIPAPGSAGTPVAGQPTAAFNALPAAERMMTIFGGDISAMSYALEESLSASSAETHISVTFTAENPTAVLAWGGHIASRVLWGEGKSAGGVNGSSYHMRVVGWSLGNLGNTDRSMSAGAVFATDPDPEPATLTVTKVVEGGTKSVADFPLFVGETSVTSGEPESLLAGTYIVRETNDDPDYVGVISGDCNPDTGSVTLTAGQPASCTITNTYDPDDQDPPVDPEDPPVDPQDPPADPEDPVTPADDPDPDVDSGNESQNPNIPVEVATDNIPPAIIPQTDQQPVVSGDELPRTGAGLREETLVGLFLLLAGLLTRSAGQRRTRPSDV